MRSRLNDSLREHGIDVDRSHEISSERDLIELLEADIGVAVLPHTASIPGDAETRQRSTDWTRAAPCISTASPGAAHRGGVRRDADAARRGLAAVSEQERLSVARAI